MEGQDTLENNHVGSVHRHCLLFPSEYMDKKSVNGCIGIWIDKDVSWIDRWSIKTGKLSKKKQKNIQISIILFYYPS